MANVSVTKLLRDMASGDTSTAAYRSGEAMVLPLASRSTLGRASTTMGRLFDKSASQLNKIEASYQKAIGIPVAKPIKPPKISLFPGQKKSKADKAKGKGGKGSGASGALWGMAAALLTMAAMEGRQYIANAASTAWGWITSANDWLEDKKDALVTTVGYMGSAAVSWASKKISGILDGGTDTLDGGAGQIDLQSSKNVSAIGTAWNSTIDVAGNFFEGVGKAFSRPLDWSATDIPLMTKDQTNRAINLFLDSVLAVWGKMGYGGSGGAGSPGGSTPTPSNGASGATPSSFANGGGATGATPGGRVPGASSGVGTTPSTAGGGALKMSAADTANAWMDHLIKNYGATPEQASRVVGNFLHETGGFKHHQEVAPLGGGRGGIGAAQWTGPRRREFEAFAAERGLSVTSPQAQMAFFDHEMKNNKGYRAALKRAFEAPSNDEGTAAFEDGYEKAGIKAYGSRFGYQRRALETYNARERERAAKGSQEQPTPPAPTDNKKPPETDEEAGYVVIKKRKPGAATASMPAQPSMDSAPAAQDETPAPQAPATTKLPDDSKSDQPGITGGASGNGSPSTSTESDRGPRQPSFQHSNAESGYMVVDMASYA